MLDSLVRVSRRVKQKRLCQHCSVSAFQLLKHRKICKIDTIISSFGPANRIFSLRTGVNDDRSIHASMSRHPNPFPCTNCCWQCRKMRHYGLLHTPLSLHARLWQHQKQTAILPTDDFLLAFHSANSSSFNSLFKVLFIFPSRYLFATGLKLMFIFTWNLPPTLHSIPKKRDSEDAHSAREAHDDKQEYHPCCCSVPRGVHPGPHWQCISTLHVGAECPDY